MRNLSTNVRARWAGRAVALIGWLAWGICATLAWGQDHEPTAADVEFFQSQVQPILATHCWKCHGATKQRGGLRLDHRTFVLQGGDLGPAVSLDEPSDSNLLRAINYEDLEMPPAGRLPDEQIAVLTEWIRRGLPWSPGAVPPVATDDAAEANSNAETNTLADGRSHWAYQPLVCPPVPRVSEPGGASNPIDRFVRAKLEQHGLTPNAPATPQVLARRLYFDLLGLPPTPEQACELASSSDPQTYPQLVDQLLSRPQFGEEVGPALVGLSPVRGDERL